MSGKFIKSACSFSLLLAAATMPAYGVPAKPGLIPYTQPDGTTVMVRLQGDEFFHHYTTEDGYLLVADGNELCYASVQPDGLPQSTGIKATDIAQRPSTVTAMLASTDKAATIRAAQAFDEAKRQASPATLKRQNARRTPRAATPAENGCYGLFPDGRYPSTGEPKALVLIVQYSDLEFTVDDPADYFTRMLTEEGFSDYGGTGSAYDFFVENSNGMFRPQFDVIGPITLPKSQSYYGGNDWWGNDANAHEMIIDGCDLIDDDIDFTQYDTDGDGKIDNVFVFYAGRGEASGGAANTVWPHSWDIQGGAGVTKYYDGVLLDRYACSNEWEGTRPDGVGTFCHEFSHVMGLPDLYATSYSSAFTPGAWSALDYGPYNNDGCTPPLYSAFERSALGWLTPAEINGPLTATLRPISSNRAGIIRTAKDTEYFLVENRQQEGWDAYIPGHGMLIWHIDYNSSVWNSNKVNDTPSHQYVDIEEADGSQSDYSREGDAFPGTANKTSFTSSTRPAMTTWGGTAINFPITDIAESADGIITFKVLGGSEGLEAPTATDATDVTPDNFTANWEAAEGTEYYLSVYTRADEEADPEYLEGYNNLYVGTTGSWLVSAVEPETQYYYTVKATNGWEESVASNEIPVFTGRLTIERRKVVALEASDIEAYGFTANWEELEDAVSYSLYLEEIIPGDPFKLTVNFDGGIENIPDGWKTSSTNTYGMKTYAGESAPALRMGKDKDRIETARYADGISSLSFWHRGNGTQSTDSIAVQLHVNGQWTTFATLSIVNAKGGATNSFTELPEGTDAAAIVYYRNGKIGSLAIDDITIEYGISEDFIGVGGYYPLEVGNVTEYTVTGIKSDQQYQYRVVATDGELFSHPSANIRVTTPKESAIGLISSEAAAFTAKANGSAITVNGADAESSVKLFDTMGRTVATVVADVDGTATVTAPAPGIYIVKAGAEAIRISITQ